MKNSFIMRFKSVIKLNIKGKNIERFLKRLYSNKIDILDIKYRNYNSIDIKIYKSDYPKLLENKSIYEIDIMDGYGLIKIKNRLKISRVLIINIIIGLILLFLLSKIIFKIEIIHSDKQLRNLISQELTNYGIKKYKMVKSYNEIENIKKNILNEHKDKIEWLEITKVGTKYIVRLEERKMNIINKNTKSRHIIAKKNATLTRIEASKGEIVKERNEYVKKGEVVISGLIFLNDEVKDKVRANGTIYGEVWYKVTVEYPFVYKEKKETGNIKNSYVLKVFDKEIELSFNKFKNKISQNKTIIKNNLLPFKLVKQKQRELELIEKHFNKNEATSMAIKEAVKKMNSKLNDKDRIIGQKTLKVLEKGSKIEVVVFFNVEEDITDYGKIIKNKE